MAKIESSAEFQGIVLSTIMKDIYMFTKIYRHINEDFFDKYSYKVMYKSIRYFYDKYSKLPALEELLSVISEINNSQYYDTSVVKSEAVALYNVPRYDEKFVIDSLEKFVKRNNVEKVLKEWLPKVAEGNNIAIDAIGEELVKGLNFSIEKSSAFKMSNIDDLDFIRKKAIGNDDNPLIIKSFIEGINRNLTFKGYKPGDLVMILGEPGGGKSMYMVNEGRNASLQGFKVLHIFIGDMNEYDGFIRYTSSYTKIPQDEIVMMPVDQQKDLVRKYNMQGFFSNIIIKAYAADEISVTELVQEVYRLQDEHKIHFDMVVVDYADNLLAESEMMYESGGSIYNKLSLLGNKNRSVVMTGSQPKIQFWDVEIKPKSAAADSSRKQHVIDIMITIGMSSKESIVGSIFLPKVRRGVDGKIIRFKTYYERAYLEAIDEQEYHTLRAN